MSCNCRPLLYKLWNDVNENDLNFSLLIFELQQFFDTLNEQTTELLSVLFWRLMNDCPCAHTIPLSLLLFEMNIGNELQDPLEDNLDLVARKLRNDVSEALDRMRVHLIVLGFHLLHEGLPHCICGLLITLEIDLICNYEFRKGLGSHFHVVWIEVRHLSDQLLHFIFAPLHLKSFIFNQSNKKNNINYMQKIKEASVLTEKGF